MPLSRPRIAAGFVVALVLTAAVAHSSADPWQLQHYAPLPSPAAHDLYSEAVSREPLMRGHALQKFRGSDWSRQDDFHHEEAEFLRHYAAEHHIYLLSALDALDRGLRKHWPTRNNTVPEQRIVPCRPRLSY